MNFKFSLIFLLSFYLNNLFAQDYLISLEKLNAPLNLNNYYVTKVIDARDNKISLGWAKKGKANRPTPVNFKKSFIAEIQDYLNFTSEKSNTPITLIIHKLRISEDTIENLEIAFCDIAVEFIFEKKSKQYSLLHCEHVSQLKQVDVALLHAQNIANAINSCTNEFSKINTEYIDSITQLPISASSKKATLDSLRYRFPIYNVQKIKNGIYTSYKDFRENNPNTSISFYLERKKRNDEFKEGTYNWEGEYNLIPRDSISGKKIKDIWGFAADGIAYIYYTNEYFPLTIEDYQTTFYAYQSFDNAKLYILPSLFGVIGTLAALEQKENAKSVRVKYSLDIITGEIKAL